MNRNGLLSPSCVVLKPRGNPGFVLKPRAWVPLRVPRSQEAAEAEMKKLGKEIAIDYKALGLLSMRASEG